MKPIHHSLFFAVHISIFALPVTAVAQNANFTSTFLTTGTFNVSPALSGTANSNPGGTQMLWYPRKAAFRAGSASAAQWTDSFIGNYSVALGQNTTAAAANSTAFGNGTSASQPNSTAFGVNSVASGAQSTAFGNGTMAPGDSSTSIGIGTKSGSYASAAMGRWNTGLGSPISWIASDPLFEIGNGVSSTAPSNALTVFKDGNMQLQGNLTLGGTITSANSTVLTNSSLSTALNLTVPPTSTAWQNTYVPKKSSATGALALGSSQATGVHSFSSGAANASGAYSSAHGNSATASGSYSLARGFNVLASGAYSLAIGSSAWATGALSTALGEASFARGNYSFTQGVSVAANSMNEVVLGSAAQAGSSRPNLWYDHDAIFRLGNGDLFAAYSSYYDKSDALTVLKNGHTTVGNKYWRRAVAQNANATLSNPPSLTDHDGEALVVDGHTRLRGKVVIEQPQGDISMGIYGGDSIQTADNVIHGVINLTFSSGSGSGTIVIDGRTISAHGIQFQGGGLDNGWFEENGQEVDPYYSGQPAVLSDGKRLTITAIGGGGIGIAILPPQ